MTSRVVVVAVMAAGLLIGCSAPGGQSTTSGQSATGATVASTTPTPSAAQSSASTPTSAGSTSAAPATTGPWTLSVAGLGPLRLGTSYTTLRQQGYVTAPTGDCPGAWTSSALQAKGVYLYPSGAGDTAVLAEISLTKATYATVSGARVGSTMSQLKVLYGSQLTTETKNGNGGPFTVAVVRIGQREIVFTFPYGSTLADSDQVEAIVARPWSADMVGEC